MSRVIERTEYGVRLEDEGGDRRFVLLECPACGVVFDQDADATDVEALLGGTKGRVAHIATHAPEDFGLAPLKTESYQQTLVADGGEKQ